MKRILTSVFYASMLLVISTASSPADDGVFRTQKVSVLAETVARGLDHPWGLDFLPDGALLVTERSGQLRVTPHLWNDDEDFDRLIDALGKAL